MIRKMFFLSQIIKQPPTDGDSQNALVDPGATGATDQAVSATTGKVDDPVYTANQNGGLIDAVTTEKAGEG